MIIRRPEELALYIRNFRKQQHLSQKDVADLVGLKQSTLSAFENNPEGTKLGTLLRILSAVNLEIQITPKERSPLSKQNPPWTEEW